MNCIDCRNCIEQEVDHCVCDDIIVAINVNMHIGEDK